MWLYLERIGSKRCVSAGCGIIINPATIEKHLSMQCNICEGEQFVDFNGRPAVMCVNCGSMERTRLLWLYLDKLGLDSDSRVLHIAPEKGIYTKISGIVSPGNYDTRDIEPGRYKFAEGIQHIDLCRLESLQSDEYDLIVHSHVLEHVTCNIAYTLFHLHRALKPAGNQIFIVPFRPGKYDESFQDIGAAERVRRFGQDDHVRSFGVEDVADHLGKLVEIDSNFDAEADIGAQLLEQYNIPRSAWKGLSPHMPICLKKHQMTLLAR